VSREGQLTARMETGVLERLERLSRREGVPRSRVAERLIDEGVRMAEFPGIVFRPGPVGRRAGLASGPDVWEIVRDLKAASARSKSDPIGAVVKTTDLGKAQVRLAAEYYAAYPDEIDERLAAEQEAVERLRVLLGADRAA
jgi:hypothetical protein